MDNYVTGWYRFESSAKIKQHQIYSYHYFSKPLVCFRDKKGVVHIFDAHCPHLGAHLGVGGKIKNDRLVCPFHGWQYDSAGQCVEIPYCTVIPKKAILKRYDSEERNSFIYIHYNEPVSELPFTNISFKSLFSLQISLLELEKWRSKAQHHLFDFQSLGPGFLYDKTDDLLISLTPLDHYNMVADFSYSLKKNFHFLHVYSIKRRAQKKFGLLIKT